MKYFNEPNRTEEEIDLEPNRKKVRVKIDQYFQDSTMLIQVFTFWVRPTYTVSTAKLQISNLYYF